VQRLWQSLHSLSALVDMFCCLIVCRAVIDIFWESTLVFFVAYKPADSGTVEQPWLVQVSLSVSREFLLVLIAVAACHTGTAIEQSLPV